MRPTEHPPFDLGRFGQALFFTGAGMSAESGVPTYRGAGGIWGQYPWQEVACQAAFERDPAAVLAFHEDRRRRVLACAPHEGHRHLARLQQVHSGLAIVTQNTDGLHDRAGCRDVTELHGSLWRVRCPNHGAREDVEGSAYATRSCPDCGARWRPDITWFGDPLESRALERAERLAQTCQLFVAVGTSAMVWPAAGVIPAAHAGGALMIEVNLEDSDLTHLFDVRLRGPAGRWLPEAFPLP